MLRVDLLAPDALPDCHRSILGVVGFQAPRPPCLPAGIPWLDLALPPAHAPTPLEVWTTDAPVATGIRHGFALARSGDLLFGAIEMPLGPDLIADSCHLYETMLDMTRAEGCPTLLRVYNYIPDIAGLQEGEERYRLFNAGRRAAFDSAGLRHRAAPAASGLGSAGHRLQLYVLASSRDGLRIENPRQVSACDYPPRYGAAPPIFARALVVDPNDAPLLLVSGTASIVSHESRHPGDAAAQTDETVRNLEAILAECRRHGFAVEALDQLKVYLRPGIDRDQVAARLDAFAGAAPTVWLQAEICRPELLVEIEAVCRLRRDRTG